MYIQGQGIYVVNRPIHLFFQLLIWTSWGKSVDTPEKSTLKLVKLPIFNTELQPVAKMMRHSHGKTTFLASNRSWSQVCKI